MAFKVDPDALDKFADLLERYTADSEDIKNYCQQATISSSNTGLFLSMTTTHDIALTEATDRMTLMHTVGGNSCNNVEDAARLYREREAENADALAKADAEYPGTTHDPITTEHWVEGNGLADEAYGFQDIADPGAELRTGFDATDYEPQLTELEDTFRQWSDLLSLAAWARKLAKEVYGIDPVEEAVQWMFGDWRGVAKCAYIWRNCEYSVKRMHQNLVYSDNALARVWEGNAADAAISFFQRLQVATEADRQFFEYLANWYGHYVEIVHHATMTANDLINFALDKLLTAIAIGASFGMYGAVAWLTQPANNIFLVLQGISDVVRVIDIIDSYINLPDKMPEHVMEQLGAEIDPSAGYKYPEYLDE